MCTSVQGRGEDGGHSQWLLLGYRLPLGLGRISHWPGTCLLGEAVRPMNFKSPSSPPPSVGILDECITFMYYHVIPCITQVWGANSGPHAYIAGTLLIGISPALNIFIGGSEVMVELPWFSGLPGI